MPERVGLSAFLKFQGDAAVAGMKKASSAFSGMHRHAKMAREGVRDLQRGFAGFGIATAAVGAGAVASVKKFADFEGQMAAVKAVLGKEAEPSFERLEARAMELGATTSFTGKQAAEAMESLARSGMDADQVLGAIGPTMAAAAADGMDLASAADIIASSMKSFGLEAKDTERIADTLAFVSRKTNTDIRGLGEGLKFVAPVAKKLGIGIEDTSAALGALADVGLKGTLAGTGLKNALLKLSTSAKKGVVQVGKYKAAIVTTNEGSVNLAETMKSVIGALSKITVKTDRAAAAANLLGLRGMGAEAAFDALGQDTKKMNVLFTDMAKRAKGTAKEMEEMRLKGFYGDMVRLKSAVDGAMASLGKMIAPEIAPAIKGITQALGDAAKILGVMWGAKGELGRAFVEQDLITEGFNKTVVSFVKGFVEGIKSAGTIFKVFADTIKGTITTMAKIFGLGGLLGEGGTGLGGITKIAIQMGALALSIKVATKGFSRMASVATGSFKLIGGVLGGARTGLGGVLTTLGKYSPIAGKLGAKILPRLTGAVAAAEKVTANPVRVVNFDEMVGIPGVRPPGVPPPIPGAPEEKIKETSKQVSKLGKVARVAGGGVALLGAAVAGWQLGKAIDEATGLSDKIADFARDWGGMSKVVAIERRAMKARFAAGAARPGTAEARQVATQMAEFAKRQITIQQKEKGVVRRVAVTRELAVSKIRQRIQGDLTKAQTDAILAGLRPILERIPTERTLVLNVDGKQMARVTAKTDIEARQRRGKRPAPAEARRAATR